MFSVLDAKRRVQLSPVQNFTITVRPQSTEFTSPSSSVDHVATIVVPQGHSVQLGSHWLSTVGHQMPEDQLEVVLNIAPQHGNLTQIQNGYDIKIEEGKCLLSFNLKTLQNTRVFLKTFIHDIFLLFKMQIFFYNYTLIYLSPPSFPLLFHLKSFRREIENLKTYFVFCSKIVINQLLFIIFYINHPIAIY